MKYWILYENKEEVRMGGGVPFEPRTTMPYCGHNNFVISEKESAKINEWMEKIKDLFGEYGHYDYTFSPYGIGMGIKVTSHLTGTTLVLNEWDDE